MKAKTLVDCFCEGGVGVSSPLYRERDRCNIVKTGLTEMPGDHKMF